MPCIMGDRCQCNTDRRCNMWRETNRRACSCCTDRYPSFHDASTGENYHVLPNGQHVDCDAG